MPGNLIVLKNTLPISEKVKTILFVTSASMSTNPRCFKEAKLAASNGYKVHVMAFEMNNALAEEENRIVKENCNITFHYQAVSRKDVFNWLCSSFITKFYRVLNFFFRKDQWINNYSFDRRSWLTKHFLNNLNFQPDLIIAHNPVVFFPVSRYAGKMNIPYAIDVEDYHPGEGKDIRQQQRALNIMKSSLPGARYVSYAAPLIRKYTEEKIKRNNISDFVVNNAFTDDDFIEDTTVSGKLKFVWFSQHIGFNRGLEDFLPLFDEYKEHIQIDLIGMLNLSFYQAYLSSRKYINIVAPLGQPELNRRICHYDIGLALENAAADLNRDICLTNKIIAYRQAGLYILATATSAQVDFMEQHPQAGELIDTGNFKDVIKQLLENKESIRSSKKERFASASELSWENESRLVLNAWSGIFN